jgi:phosphate transport system protein
MSVHMTRELENLKNRLLYLASITEQNVRHAGQAVKNLNSQMAQTVIDGDHQIDLEEVAVEEDCLKILALYQPVASDLRTVVSILKINSDLERIGDLAVNIAERVIYLEKAQPVSDSFNFEDMWMLSLKMLKEALDSFVNRDLALAKKVCDDDDAVDKINRDMYGRVYRGVRTNPDDVEAYFHYLAISRHLERLADYATNIAEDVIYLIEGKIVRHSPERFVGESSR